jgi:hypothetical protein
MAQPVSRSAVLAGALFFATVTLAETKKAQLVLPREHTHPSGAFTFRTPEDWTVTPSPTEKDAVAASGAGVLVRFLFQRVEAGYDSLHASCMLERLAPPMETEPRVKYEYDFVGGMIGDRRALDSAFTVRYDNPVQGHREWRQRNLTIVGGGQSLCAIAYAPVQLWKKSAETRATLDAVLTSVVFAAR